MTPISLQMVGRFGNQAIQYLYARAYAEQNGLELRTPRWIGEQIFQIEPTAEPDYRGEYLHGYFQNQESCIYTKSDVQKWFQFQPWVHGAMKLLSTKPDLEHAVVAHLRRGDFIPYGYPAVAVQSYHDCCHEHGLDAGNLCFVSEEYPTVIGGLEPTTSFLPDFYAMCATKTLLRANSTFSWVAGAINPNRVFSPVIDGLEGGKVHRCKFVEGNHPRLANLDGITEMRLQP